ncbi:hypothetical protein [Melghirimyces algeriensis]|uniref:Uncharacterized protein n=1 Tax=Melghirimyces algeriensis TaxID=910412 RepID=A0A521C6Z3_9BACL|nr:hypothetical protein [Melghirimyces algeriensis]SMO54460.1 hypothetical protein SAMN06264849_103131 [Melghirimyces algeriensis]
MIHFWQLTPDHEAEADLKAHRELLSEAEKALRWAEHIGDERKVIQWLQEVEFRRDEIRRLEALLERKRSA